ncbi:MAG: ATP-binding cassette domain-containing protein [Myxococcales bacterium]|nr:ATP-binding cassette domain-containing protein [Myxococcales bacterium]
MTTLALDVRLALGSLRLDVVLTTSARNVAIRGPSGAGKSSILRVIAGLERRAIGTVATLGRDLQGARLFVPTSERGLGWVPQAPSLFPHRTVGENLRWASARGGRSSEPLEIAELIELSVPHDRRPETLSGGERQRVALGRALLSSPSMLLLDEPFSALDRDARERLRARLGEWCAARGIVTVLVSHDDGDVAALSGEVWTLTGGRLSRG